MCALNKGMQMFRQMMDGDLYFQGEFDKVHAYLDLILMAESEPVTRYINGQYIEIGVGCVAVSLRDLSSRWKWGVKKVRNFLTKLQSEGYIEVDSKMSQNVIKIDSYREMFCEGKGTPKVTPKGTGLKPVTHSSTTNYKDNISQEGTPKGTPKGTPSEEDTPKGTGVKRVTLLSSLNYGDDISQEDTPKGTPQGAEVKEKRKENIPPTPPIKENKKESFPDIFSNENNRVPSTRTHMCASAYTGAREENFTLESDENTPTPTKQKRATTPPSLITKCREVFEAAYEVRYGSSYYWEAKDAASMKKLIQKISFNRKSRGQPIEDSDIVEAFRLFIDAINKDWIFNNFSLPKINGQYNDIIAEIKNRRYAAKPSNPISQTTHDWFVGQANTLVDDLAALDAECERQLAGVGAPSAIPQAVGSAR